MARFEFSGVPSVTPTGAPSDEQRISATPEMFGGSIARAEQTLGQGVEHAGETGLDVITARQHLTNEISASETNTWLAKNLTDKFNDFGKLQGKAAQDALPQFKQDTEDLYQDSLKNAGNNLQMKAMLAKSGRYLTDAYYRYGTNHADGQWRTWQSKTFDDRANEFGNQAAIAAQHGTWDEVDAYLGTSADEVRKKFEAQGWSREDIEPEVKKRNGANVKNIVETLDAKGDLPSAEKVFDTYKEKMDAASVLAVESHLGGERAKIRGHTIADEETGRVPRPSSAEFLKTRSGKARIEGVNPEFADRLTRAAQDYEAQTGSKARFESVKRSTEEQAEIYQRHQQMPGGVAAHPAAPPGSSRHERGEAADIPDGPFLNWMHQNGEKYGLEFLKGRTGQNDPGHVQMAAGGTPTGTVHLPDSAGPPDKATVFNRIIERTKDDPRAQAAAITRMNQIFSVERTEQTQAKVLFNQRIKDTTAEAHNNGTVTNPLTEDDFMKLPNMSVEQRQQHWQEYQDDLELGTNLHAAASMSPQDRAATVPPEPTPGPGYDRAFRKRTAYLHELEKLETQRREDPAGYAIDKLPDAKAAYQGMQKVEADKQSNDEMRKAARANYAAVMRDEQARVGGQPDDVRLLPKNGVEALNKQFAAAVDSEDAQARTGLVGGIQHEAQLWGDSWPTVMRQLAPQTQPVIRAIAAGADPTAMTRLLSLGKDENPGKILKEQSETKFNQVTTALNEEMRPFLNSLIGRQRDRDFGVYYGLGEKLAALYVRDGDDASTAAHKAFNALIGDRYEFKDTWRMPKSAGVSANDVQAGVEDAKIAIRNSGSPQIATSLEDAKRDLNLTPQEEALYRRHVTNLTGSGGVDNPDGSRSSLFALTVGSGDKTYIIPTVHNGKLLSTDDAIAQARNEGLDKFPSYATQPEAKARYDKMHDYMERDTGRFLEARKANPLWNIRPAINDIGLSDNRGDSLSKFARDGKWITSADQSGLNLVYDDKFVKTNDGKPLLLSWGDLAKRAPAFRANVAAGAAASTAGP